MPPDSTLVSNFPTLGQETNKQNDAKDTIKRSKKWPTLEIKILNDA